TGRKLLNAIHRFRLSIFFGKPNVSFRMLPPKLCPNDAHSIVKSPMPRLMWRDNQCEVARQLFCAYARTAGAAVCAELGTQSGQPESSALKPERTSNNEEISQAPASTYRLWNFGRSFSFTEEQPSSCPESKWSLAGYGREHCLCASTGARCRQRKHALP